MQEPIKPYKEKLISELNSDDEFICVAGYPISIKENFLVLDDGSSTISVTFNQAINQDVKFVKAFGKVVQLGNQLAIQADFLQDLSKIDTFLYKKVRDLLKK